MTDTMELRLKQALNDTTPTLIEFYADWCPHCQAMMPVVAELRERLGGSAHVIQIEGDEHEAILSQYGVKSYPTWILMNDGQEVWRDSGEKPLGELEDMVRRFV